MPIDATLPLQVKPPAPYDPMASAQKALTLRNLLQEGAFRQQQAQEQSQMHAANLQGQQLQNEKQQRELEGGKVLTELIRENMKIGPDGRVTTDQAAIERGLIDRGFADVAEQHKKNLASMRETFAKADDADLERTSKQLGLVGQVFGPVVMAPPEQRPAVFAQQKELAQRLGLDVSDFPQQYDDSVDAQLNASFASGMTIKEQADNARQKAELGARLPGTQAESLDKQLSLIRKNMAGVQNAGQWAQARQFLQRRLPAGLVDEYVPQEYSPEAVAQMEGLAEEGAASRTRIFGGRVWQYNTRTGKYDRDLGPSEGTLGREERAGRVPGTAGGKALTPSQAQSALRLVQSEARYEQTSGSEEFYGKSLGEVERVIADRREFDLDELNRVATGKAPVSRGKAETGAGAIAAGTRKTMPDGTVWEKTAQGYKRVK